MSVPAVSVGSIPRVVGEAPFRTYQHAHWFFLAALAAIIGGFWPSFFRPLGAGDLAHSVHGVTATLWVVALATQSFLMSRGLVRWHRRVAYGALLYARVFAPRVDFMMALHGSFLTVELVLVALIVADRRAGERRLAYPLSLAFFVAVHALMFPVAGSDAWQSMMQWYAGLPLAPRG